MKKAAVSARIGKLVLLSTLAVVVGLLVTGCGGTRQDKGAVAGTWTISVDKFAFPARQPLGTPTQFKLVITNRDTRDIPQLAVTLNGLQQYVNQPGLATNTRPVWVPDDVSHGQQTAYDTALGSTFDLGILKAGATQTFDLHLTPIRRGSHTISYSIGANLYGSGKTKLENGAAATGKLVVAVDPTPQINRSIFN